MEEKKEIRQQVNELVGRELSDEEFKCIDCSGIMEALEFNADDLPDLPWAFPTSIVVGGILIDLMGMSYRTPPYLYIVIGLFLCLYSLETVVTIRKKRATVKRLIRMLFRNAESERET